MNPSGVDGFVLVHHQHPDSDVRRQPGQTVRYDQPAADVHARSGLGIPAIAPEADLQAWLERQPALEAIAARGLQARPETGHRRVGCCQTPGRVVHALDARTHPQRIRLDRQPEAAHQRVRQLAPHSAGRHGHRDAAPERRARARRQRQGALAVTGHPPHRDPHRHASEALPYVEAGRSGSPISDSRAAVVPASGRPVSGR